jgi:phosphoribosyl-AMP cyclohydrolase
MLLIVLLVRVLSLERKSKLDKKELEEGQCLAINFAKRGGLVPAVVQDVHNGRILMIAYVNQEAFDMTLQRGMATFWSTSRNELWTKGETSGDFLKIIDVLVDCDQDALIYRVEPQGAGACHTKDPDRGAARKSCFYRKVELAEGTLVHLKG